MKQEWTWAGDGGVNRDLARVEIQVGNGQTKSGVLTSTGYRSWMVELDRGSG